MPKPNDHVFIVGGASGLGLSVARGAGAMVDPVAARAPGRRLPTIEDVVHAVFFLMDNRAVNGIDLEIDAGGLLV